jgi:hypothetical protein
MRIKHYSEYKNKAQVQQRLAGKVQFRPLCIARNQLRKAVE